MELFAWLDHVPKDRLVANSTLIEFRKFAQVYHVPEIGSENLNTFEFLGATVIFVGEMVAATDSPTRELVHHSKKDNGTISFTAEEMKNLKMQCLFKMRAEKLPPMDFFTRKADPYVVFGLRL